MLSDPVPTVCLALLMEAYSYDLLTIFGSFFSLFFTSSPASYLALLILSNALLISSESNFFPFP